MSSYRMKYKIGATQYHIPVVDDMAGFGSGIPLGTILPYSANTLNPPEGFLFCDGSAISRAMYPDLFALIGTLYGSGDGSTTFNLPDLIGGKFLEGTMSAGTSKSAGLPNITGQTGGGRSDSGLYKEGAFSNQAAAQQTNGISVSAMSYAQYPIAFDASLSNPIYGNSDTVQPSSVTVRYIIKAFSATTSNSELIDITQYASALNGKSSKSLNDLSQAGEDHFYENDFTIVYPNNGSEQNPANVTKNSQYIEDNPFPGYIVNCVVEIQRDGTWYQPGFWADGNDNNSHGTYVIQSSDINHLKIETGSYSVSPSYGPKFSICNMSNVVLTSAPCRVKVWKIGKILQSS